MRVLSIKVLFLMILFLMFSIRCVYSDIDLEGEIAKVRKNEEVILEGISVESEDVQDIGKYIQALENSYYFEVEDKLTCKGIGIVYETEAEFNEALKRGDLVRIGDYSMNESRTLPPSYYKNWKTGKFLIPGRKFYEQERIRIKKDLEEHRLYMEWLREGVMIIDIASGEKKIIPGIKPVLEALDQLDQVSPKLRREIVRAGYRYKIEYKGRQFIKSINFPLNGLSREKINPNTGLKSILTYKPLENGLIRLTRRVNDRFITEDFVYDENGILRESKTYVNLTDDRDNPQKGRLYESFLIQPYNEDTKIKELKLIAERILYGRGENENNEVIKKEIQIYEYYTGRILKSKFGARDKYVFYPQGENSEIEKLIIQFGQNGIPVNVYLFLRYKNVRGIIQQLDIAALPQTEKSILITLFNNIKFREDHTIATEEFNQIDILIDTYPLLIKKYILDVYGFPVEIIFGTVNTKDSLRTFIYYDNFQEEIGRVNYRYNPLTKEYDMADSISIFKHYGRKGASISKLIQLSDTRLLKGEIDKIIVQFNAGKQPCLSTELQGIARTCTIDIYSHIGDERGEGLYNTQY